MSSEPVVVTTLPAGAPIYLDVPAAVRDRFTLDEIARLLALRRELHRQPELSWKEYATSDRLAAVAESLGGEVTRVANTGVVARFRGREAGAPVVALRGDIDALPIQEETGLDYASAVPGVMHA